MMMVLLETRVSSSRVNGVPGHRQTRERGSEREDGRRGAGKGEQAVAYDDGIMLSGDGVNVEAAVRSSGKEKEGVE
ncbi:hypothetical protein NPX13_g6310 [Xylaria arbuscula]|uniref:Uncharacterized protein n=1 Tax=Xylaria arbuscula TaxID=114810 RepID=A0A9W8NCF4_9PEZI|nr:hypothetical protein NPX13_g6310 [Xylaria arbuscula]